MNRRNFLKYSALASGTLLVPNFLKAFESKNILSGNKKLVIIQLSGGNDALNTIVPYTNDLYFKNRAGIAIKKEQAITLTPELGLNTGMKKLMELYDKGFMTIINNVGYPNPDRSHFRSMDIWHTASNSNEYLQTGWLGRYLDSSCNGCANPHHAIEVDDTLSLALKGELKKAMALKNADELYKLTKENFFNKLVSITDDKMLTEDNLGYLYKTMIETTSSAEYIYNTSKTYNNSYVYPQTALGKQLKTVSTFINSGMETSVYYVSMGGFDTHINQLQQHQNLLQTFADAVTAFVNDLQKSNKLDDTLVMVFSEFGRRVQQNASNGTDHGTAGNMFLFGNKLKQNGIINEAPDLTDLDDGDLKYKIDFRSVYATVLNNWLGVSDKEILLQNFAKMSFV
jgi:uncharacterized protein (DUF1501 family)